MRTRERLAPLLGTTVARCRRKMGEFANGRVLSAAARSVAAVIVAMNVWLLVGTARAWMG